MLFMLLFLKFNCIGNLGCSLLTQKKSLNRVYHFLRKWYYQILTILINSQRQGCGDMHILPPFSIELGRWIWSVSLCLRAHLLPLSPLASFPSVILKILFFKAPVWNLFLEDAGNFKINKLWAPTNAMGPEIILAGQHCVWGVNWKQRHKKWPSLPF